MSASSGEGAPSSLKLKIHLPGKIGQTSSSTEHYPDSKAPTLNSSKPTSEANPDDYEAPLRIKIRKPDQAAEPVSNPNVITLSFFPFPSISQASPLLQQAVASNSPDGNLHEWDEKNIAALKDELENVRHSIREFSTNIQGQIDLLENWKNKKDAPEPGLVSPQVKKKGRPAGHTSKKQKTSGEFGSDTESSAVYQYDEDSGDDDREINVGDTEDQTYDGSEIDRREAKNKKAQARAKGKIAGNTKKNTPLNVNKKANAQTPKSAANAAAAAAAATPGRPRERKNRRTSNQTDDMYLEPEEDEDFGGKYGKSTFWTDMEPYFAAFTDFDLRFCAPVNVDADECIVSIPPLGKHYRDVWAEEDSEELERIKSVVVEPPIGIAAENEPGEKPVACGDLTSRILSALIEEDIVPSNTYIQNQTVHTKENGSSHLEDSRFLSNLSPFKEYYGSGDSNGSGLPIETPPTYDYSFAGVHSLEERIKMELRSIGLLDDDGQYNSQREDDEICSEIRKLQKQLRDRTIATNVLRSKLQPQVAAAITKEEHDKKERINNANLEKQYLKLMRKKKATRSTKPKEIT